MAEKKDSPLDALRRRTSPITDVVYGADHPAKQPKKAPPQKPRAAVNTGTSLVGDLLDPVTKQRLSALQGRLEGARRRMNTGKGKK